MERTNQMKITALKTFRDKHSKGELIRRGTEVDVDEEYGKTLVQTGLAVSDAKALKDHNNKMLADFQDKRLPTHVESAEERTQGLEGPEKNAETPDQRSQGYAKGTAQKETAKPSDTPTTDKPLPKPEKVKVPGTETELTKHQIGKPGVKPSAADPTLPANPPKEEVKK